MEKIFASFDSNKDGKIDHHGKKGTDEYDKLVEAVATYCVKELTTQLENKDALTGDNAPNLKVTKVWVAGVLDANGDGTITKDEFIDHLMKALNDTDADCHKRAQAFLSGEGTTAAAPDGV